jgi:hypothetical protein
MNISDVMDELGAKLDTITGLRVYPYPANKVTPPAAIVLADIYTYDETYARGMDRLALVVDVVLSAVTDRASRDAIALYASGSGPASVKRALETGPHVAMDTVRVTSVEFGRTTVAAVEYLLAKFHVDITGSGA